MDTRCDVSSVTWSNDADCWRWSSQNHQLVYFSCTRQKACI